mgnify:CR=1 FL=1
MQPFSQAELSGHLCLFCEKDAKLIHYSEVIQVSLEPVLGGEAGVHKEAFFVIPLFKATVIEQLQIVLDNEGNDVVLQALFKEDQAAYAAISVLKGMDAFKSYMKGYDVLKGLLG